MNRSFLASVLLGVPVLLQAQVIAGGVYHSLAVCASGTVMSWGSNMYGQLGDGTTTPSSVPVQVSSLTDVTAVSAGDHLSLALRSDSTVWSWGGNGEGELGNWTTAVSASTPGPVIGLSGVVAIAGKCSAHALALKADGTVWCWGRDNNGQLGDGGSTDSNVPVQALTPSGIIAIAGGSYHSMALRNDGTVWAWGNNTYGVLGNGTTAPSSVPVQVAALTNIVAIAAGGYHSMALQDNGTVWAWGYNLDGELGDGSYMTSIVPVQLAQLTNVSAIFAGGFYSLAQKTDGTVWVWGSNSQGQLGNGSDIGGDISIPTPVQVDELTDTHLIAVGFQHGLALSEDGVLRAWGTDLSGELGDGNIEVDSNVPVPVTGVCTMVATGVEEHTGSTAFSLSPNPGTGLFRVEGLAQGAIADLRIHDVWGRVVRPSKFDSARAEIDLSAQPSGVYLVTIATAGRTYSTRLIKE